MLNLGCFGGGGTIAPRSQLSWPRAPGCGQGEVRKSTTQGAGVGTRDETAHTVCMRVVVLASDPPAM